MAAPNEDLLYTKDGKKQKKNTLRTQRNEAIGSRVNFICIFIYYLFVLSIALLCFKFIVIIYVYSLCTITLSRSRLIAGLLLLLFNYCKIKV